MQKDERKQEENNCQNVNFKIRASIRHLFFACIGRS